MPKLSVGDEVSWTSQAGGNWRRKTGRVLAIVASGNVMPSVDVTGRWRTDSTPGRRVDGDRYVVCVWRKGKKGQSLLPFIYAPKVSVIDKVKS